MEDNNNTVTLNFTRMIYQYLHHSTVNNNTDIDKREYGALSTKPSTTATKKQKVPYIKRHPINSLHYLLLMTLYSTQTGYFNNNMVTLARSYVRDLILSTDDYKYILGIPQPDIGKQVSEKKTKKQYKSPFTVKKNLTPLLIIIFCFVLFTIAWIPG
jgi:hypothetical protein